MAHNSNLNYDPTPTYYEYGDEYDPVPAVDENEEEQETEYLQSSDPDQEEVQAAADAYFAGQFDHDDWSLSIAYEHGQWWVTVEDYSPYSDEPTTQYSVVDTSEGLDFEQL